MNEENKIIIERLKTHIQQIISKYESAASDNRNIYQELAKKQKELEINKNKILELEKKIEE